MYKMKSQLLFLFAILILATADNSTEVKIFLKSGTVTQHNLHSTFQRTSVLYGLSTISDEQLIEAYCHAHLQQFQHGVLNKQPWALKMFDASASIEPGFTFGHNFWLGNREVCNAVEHPAYMQMSAHLPHQMSSELLNSVAPFSTDFRVIYLRHNSSWQVDPVMLAFATRIHVGLCLPTACSELEVQHLMQAYLTSNLLAGNELYDMNLVYDYAKDLKLKASTFRRTSFILCCLFIVTTIGLTISAALIRKPENIELHTEKISEAPEEAQQESANYVPIKSPSAVIQQQFQTTSFLACYDIQANWRLLFAPAKVGYKTAALNGVRFGSALCVTFYHYLMFIFNGSRNKLTLFNYLGTAGNVDIFVDIFFTISGFLQAYNHFRNKKLLEVIRKGNFTQNLKLIGVHLFHRYLRLAPLYFLIIGCSDFGAQLIDDISLFHIDYKLQVNCSKYWWQNFLFIQNFFNHNNMCCLWTWSLACDMQFSILATVLLFTYVKHPRRTKFCLIALVFANISYTYIMGLKLNFDHTLESTFAFLTETYINPLSRVLAYLTRCIAGWFFVEQRRLPFALSKSTQQFLGYLVTLVLFGCIIKPRYHNHSPFGAATVLLLERITFAFTISILIVSSANGYMRWLFRIFESFLFQKFNKVAYAMFLLNPVVIFALPGFSQSNLYANPLNMLVEYIGVVVILVLFSILFSLLFDVPYQNLSKLIIARQLKLKHT